MIDGKKTKYYVVWEGRKPGIYFTWAECKPQVDLFPGARHLSFKTLKEAERAYDGTWKKAYNHVKPRQPQKKAAKKQRPSTRKQRQTTSPAPLPQANDIVVDGAWSDTTYQMEWQGIKYGTGEKVFSAGPIVHGTNNIAEFLAVVDALKYCHENGLACNVYSDSQTAIAWVRDQTVKTTLPRNKNTDTTYSRIDGALNWLRSTEASVSVLKWDTRTWGENPADFGRK